MNRVFLCRARRAVILIAALVVLALVVRADEPYARSRDYDLLNARIALRFDLEQHKVLGEVTHTLAPLRDGLTRLAFDSVGLTISSVAVNGQPAKFESSAAQLLVALDHPARAGKEFDIHIRYEGRPKKGLYFILPDKNYPTGPGRSGQRARPRTPATTSPSTTTRTTAPRRR